jgi:LytS/YehU family sensor histidine kinase
MKSEKEQLKTELSLLKAQVNPHFLFNTLNNLYGLILQNENLQAAEITLKLSDLMRYLLESSKTERISLQKEIKFLEDYLVLEKIRLSAQADIRFVVYGLEKDIFVAPLFFIPFVENAFKHGLQSISESSFAHFSLSIQGKDLFFEAVNSVGQNITTPEKSGTGLENLRKRLELLYPEKHLLEVEKNEGIFKVILQISI